MNPVSQRDIVSNENILNDPTQKVINWTSIR
jgi:hypothetical protein